MQISHAVFSVCPYEAVLIAGWELVELFGFIAEDLLDVSLMVMIMITCFAVGFVVLGYGLHRRKLAQILIRARQESEKLVENSRLKADQLMRESLHEAQENNKQQRKQFEREARQRRQQYQKLEQKTRKRESQLDKKSDIIAQRESAVDTKELRLAEQEKQQVKNAAELKQMIEENQKLLEKTAQMSVEEAKETLLQSVKNQAQKESKRIIADIEEETKRTAQQQAQHILSLAIQRGASEFVGDATVTVVALPDEGMKGRIIGREGRNIRALEQATGVDVIIDDTPEAVILSSFNAVRREIARIALEKLMEDGRIHPARIEEVSAKVTQEFDQTLKDYGAQAAYDVGVTDFHPYLLTYLGHLRFQLFGKRSLLQSALETAKIAGSIAQAVGVSVISARRAGLLHEIGKAVNQEEDGHHADIGAKLCERYGESAEIVRAIRHYYREDIGEQTLLTICLSAASIAVKSRMHGYYDQLAFQVKRLEDMENLVVAYDGVDKAIVFQAGREIRVVVDPDQVMDENMRELSQDIATRIKEEISFPGKVKVTLLRESTYVDYAQ